MTWNKTLDAFFSSWQRERTHYVPDAMPDNFSNAWASNQRPWSRIRVTSFASITGSTRPSGDLRLTDGSATRTFRIDPPRPSSIVRRRRAI